MQAPCSIQWKERIGEFCPFAVGHWKDDGYEPIYNVTPDGLYLYYDMVNELHVWDLKSKTMKILLNYGTEIVNVVTYDMKTFATTSESSTQFFFFLW